MALVVADLTSDLLDCFQSMQDGDNKKFSQGIAKAFKDYIENGYPRTHDQGTIASGTFSGDSSSNSSSIEVDVSDCEDTIYKACNKMLNEMTTGGNDFLAEKIAEGLQKMLDSAIIKTLVVGFVTLPTGTISPIVGDAQGSVTCTTAPIVVGLKACFSAMIPMVEGGDNYMALQLATLVDACVKAGTVNTTGLYNLTGSTGVGNII